MTRPNQHKKNYSQPSGEQLIHFFDRYLDGFCKRIHTTVTSQETSNHSSQIPDECVCIDVLAKDIFLLPCNKEEQLKLMRERIVKIESPIPFQIRIVSQKKTFEIIYNHEFEQQLQEWIAREPEKVEEAIAKRKAYYRQNLEK